MPPGVSSRYPPGYERHDYATSTTGLATDFHDGLRPTAKRNLHVQEILNSIAQTEGITASDEDRAPRIEATAKNYGMTAEQFTKMMEPGIFDPEIIMQKTMKFLLDNAELTTE